MSKYTDKRNEEFESYRNPHEDERYDGYDNNETCKNKSRRGIRLLIIVRGRDNADSRLGKYEQ